MPRLSVAIITFNEEKHIARCIDSVSEIADDIVVVDSFSTDGTKEICLNKKVRFIENKFLGHIEQKNFALGQAENDYVLALDADEALNEQAVKAVIDLKNGESLIHAEFNRLTNYCGKWIKHCGWYPDRKLRLVDRRITQWGGENPHDRMTPSEQVTIKRIDADILHYAIPSIASHAQRANAFSTIAAQQAIEKNKKIYFVIHIILNPLFTFIKKYFFQLGFLDGFYGFVICILSAHSNFLKYTKIWSLKNENTDFANG